MTDISERAGELEGWWRSQAIDEIERTVPKAVEYGADDLADVGRELGLSMGRAGLSWEEQVELGLYFYLVGKIARWRSAARRGDRPSDDTLFDIGVYVRMAQRNRQVGGWPFPPETKPEAVEPEGAEAVTHKTDLEFTDQARSFDTVREYEDTQRGPVDAAIHRQGESPTRCRIHRRCVWASGHHGVCHDLHGDPLIGRG